MTDAHGSPYGFGSQEAPDNDYILIQVVRSTLDAKKQEPYNALMARRRKNDTANPAIKPDREGRVRILRMDEPAEPETPVEDSGLSLEDLGQAYAALLSRGELPYEEMERQVPDGSTAPVEPEIDADFEGESLPPTS